MTTPVLSPVGMPFPITVDQLIPKIGSYVEKGDRLMAYKFWYMVEIANSPDDNDEDIRDPNPTNRNKKKVRESIEFFEAPFEGTLMEWNVDKGDEIVSPNQSICEIKRPCNHDIVYGGLCTMCGKEVDEADQQFTGGNITISHTDVNLKVSRKEASDIGNDIKVRLRKEKKLVLVVDLDQTVIHCGVDPTIGEWKRDPSNPNFETLKDVRSFTLEEEPILPFMYMGPKPPLRKCWYYVKVRPGLKEFFEKVAPLFELHIYTMATRAYALKIAEIIDPDGSLFGNRILSRDENGSMTQKSLERLFPTDQSMVVIIDDRGDVWNWSPNLIKVIPYNFFVGVGDINSNFLPKQQTTILQMVRRSKEKPKESDELLTDIMDSEKKLQEKIDEEVKRQEEKLNHQLQPVEEPNSSESKEEWTKKLEYSASLEVQQQNRPLAALQKHFHEKLLVDDDDELFYLKDTLASIHEKYYQALDANPSDDSEADIKIIMTNMKRKVFEGCHFVFSGLIPLNTNIQKADIVIWTSKFGAVSSNEITEETTHIITKTPSTFKAKLAKSFNPNIKVVSPDWIFECLINWKRVDESRYTLIVDQRVSSTELQKFKEKLQKLKDEREEKERERERKQIQEDLDNPRGVSPSTLELFGGNTSWLNDDDDEDIPDSDDSDEDSEEENLPLNEVTENEVNGKRPLDGIEQETIRKKVHTEATEISDEESDSDLEGELMSMLDS